MAVEPGGVTPTAREPAANSVFIGTERTIPAVLGVEEVLSMGRRMARRVVYGSTMDMKL